LNKNAFNPLAMASDVARSRRQYFARKIGDFIVGLLRLNAPGFFTTEIVQKIDPVCRIKTQKEDMRCVGGHGRLLWRANTFYTEEPYTVAWLDTLTELDLLWDVGANVGLYGIYAAMIAGCKVVSFEPEAMNYAILIRNIVLNNLQDRITATNVPLTQKLDLGRLHVGAITRGGAWNQFSLESDTTLSKLNPFVQDSPITQLQFGVSMDELVEEYGLDCPTHIKIDVDGNEPEIINGAGRVLENPKLDSILIEQERNNTDHDDIERILHEHGFRIVSAAVTGESRPDMNVKDDWVWRNVIWRRND
jgi:FkbM family methyltransferase|tara:strand:+ start:1945 stop:2859 length:915 start_codon:yes stop_codon:yes gene_type:complete